LILVLPWLLVQNSVLDQLLIASLSPEAIAGLDAGGRALLISEIKNAAAGTIFGEPSPAVLEAADRLRSWQFIAGWAMVVVALALAILGLFFGRSRLSARFRARSAVEAFTFWTMVLCSVIAILVTVGIVL